MLQSRSEFKRALVTKLSNWRDFFVKFVILRSCNLQERYQFNISKLLLSKLLLSMLPCYANSILFTNKKSPIMGLYLCY